MTDARGLRVVAVGDIMLGRGVQTTATSDAASLLEPDLLSELAGDIVTGNLECLIGFTGEPSHSSHSHFQGDPVFSRGLLERFDVVNLANNHVGDFGDRAIDETLAWLDDLGVRSVGVGLTAAEATEPATFDLHGSKVAVFGATTVGNLARNSRYRLASPNEELFSRAADFTRTGHTCLLHLHAGGGDVSHPSPSIRRLMQTLVDRGFAIVFGHHPHVLQGFQTSRDRAVFYSMGDFVFDKVEQGRDEALLVAANIQPDGSLGQTDILIVQRTRDLQISLLSGNGHDVRLKSLQDLSKLIESGASDEAYLQWRGSRIARLNQSIRRDLALGGWRALMARLARVDRRKLRELLLGR